MSLKINNMPNWSLVVERAIGGLEYIGFSKCNPNKLLCISSQKTTIIDCTNGSIIECNVDYDENTLTAVCDLLPDEEIAIAGQYGGKLPDTNCHGDKVSIETNNDYITEVTFVSKSSEIQIFKNYGYYTCGFSYDGNHFVFAQDAGITILTRS